MIGRTVLLVIDHFSRDTGLLLRGHTSEWFWINKYVMVRASVVWNS